MELELSNVDGSVGRSVTDVYVDSLFKIAKNMQSEEVFEKSLNVIVSFLESNSNYKKILAKFSLTPAIAVKFVKDLATLDIFPVEIINFLRLIAENRRFSLLPQICSSYIERINKTKGIKTVRITYAGEFDIEAKLVNELRDILRCKKVKCVLVKDDTLIAGMQIQYKSKMLDYSVKSKLMRLNNAMKRGNHEN